MSFSEQSERDRALRVALQANHYTPWDAVRELIPVLVHMEMVAREGAYALHAGADCDMCHRAAVWAPVLSGSLTGQ